MHTTEDTGGTPILQAVIPKGRQVAGLEYGRHVDTLRWAGYFVRVGSDWYIARQTPEPDDLPSTDAEIVVAIVRELGGRVEYLARDFIEQPDGAVEPHLRRCPRAAHRSGDPVRVHMPGHAPFVVEGGACHE